MEPDQNRDLVYSIAPHVPGADPGDSHANLWRNEAAVLSRARFS